MSQTINLGDRVKHKLKPIDGIVTAITEQLAGGPRSIEVQSEKPGDGEGFWSARYDECELELVESGVYEVGFIKVDKPDTGE